MGQKGFSKLEPLHQLRSRCGTKQLFEKRAALTSSQYLHLNSWICVLWKWSFFSFLVEWIFVVVAAAAAAWSHRGWRTITLLYFILGLGLWNFWSSKLLVFNVFELILQQQNRIFLKLIVIYCKSEGEKKRVFKIGTTLLLKLSDLKGP